MQKLFCYSRIVFLKVLHLGRAMKIGIFFLIFELKLLEITRHESFKNAMMKPLQNLIFHKFTLVFFPSFVQVSSSIPFIGVEVKLLWGLPSNGQ